MPTGDDADVTCTVHRDGTVTTVVVTARPGWTQDQWDAAVGRHVSLDATPVSWDTWDDDLTDDAMWLIAYRAKDVIA